MRGATLLELGFVVAIAALLAALALPAFAEWVARHRLVAVAEELAADLAEARHQAATSGQPVLVRFRPGPDWCYAVTRAEGCGCDSEHPGAALRDECRLKTVRSADWPGVELLAAPAMRFDADATRSPAPLPAADASTAFAAGLADASGTASSAATGVIEWLGSRDDARLRVRVSRLGRASVCSPTGVRGVVAC
jgi:type IV fimbrial biogenesis protein FimT